MQRRWTALVGIVAIACLIAAPALSAPPAGKSVDTETIIVPPGEAGEGTPDLSDPELGAPDGQTPDSDTGTIDPDIGTGGAEQSEPPPVVEYDVSKLPAPVRRLREQILEAALTGDIEKLRPIFEANQESPLVSFDEAGDPIDHLKSLAGDPEGREILAILIEVLDAGYVHVDVGTPDEMYVWPYFARYPIDALTGPQMVELFKLLTAGDYEDMKVYGTYLFYRVGIAPNGVWKFFVAGD